ncbi:MAG TPA: EAL-associated domain-containing protein, partial [Leptospiraceae bacterium]|nr:EAL-associated domain-containing protein [Leptospiraceae bacterium]
SLKTNWCWRPYFINHVYHSRIQNESWIISEAYHDIREEKILRTFSRTIEGKYYIFIDVDYGLSSGFE